MSLQQDMLSIEDGLLRRKVLEIPESATTTQHTDFKESRQIAQQAKMLIDYEELKKEYPFSRIQFFKIRSNIYAKIRVVAVNKAIVESTLAKEQDFTKDYSRELFLLIWPDYKINGCTVLGAKWLDIGRINYNDLHLLEHGFLDKYMNLGYKLCVGTTESFRDVKNVILENTRTADHILTAYENIMRGYTKHATLFSLKHQQAGEEEYRTLKRGGKIQCLRSKNG